MQTWTSRQNQTSKVRKRRTKASYGASLQRTSNVRHINKIRDMPDRTTPKTLQNEHDAGVDGASYGLVTQRQKHLSRRAYREQTACKVGNEGLHHLRSVTNKTTGASFVRTRTNTTPTTGNKEQNKHITEHIRACEGPDDVARCITNMRAHAVTAHAHVEHQRLQHNSFEMRSRPETINK